jgi:hypothetical protein
MSHLLAKNIMLRQAIRENRWSTLSLLITVLDAVAIFFVIRYLDWRGAWTPNSTLNNIVRVWEDLALVLSFIMAIIGLVKDASRAYGILALCLSVVSVLLYLQ